MQYIKMDIYITQIQKADIFTGLFQHIKAFTEQVNIMFEKEHLLPKLFMNMLIGPENI
jgi:hypothetical protein